MDKNRKSKNKYIRFLSFLTALCLTAGLVLLMPITASAFAGGTGTSGNPFRIETLAQLQTFRNNVNNGTNYQGQHIRLDANITLTGTGNWWMIGSSTNPFQGTFDGNGHIISGINFDGGGTSSGFFHTLGANATVRNLGLSNLTITNLDSAGGITARNSGIIENCFVSGTITTTATHVNSGVGGIAGRNDGTIRNCFTDVSVTGGNHAGGIVGIHNNGGRVERCYALRTVLANTNHAGGIVGNNQSGSTVSNCVAIQTSVTTAGANVGRIAGSNTGSLSNNFGDVTQLRNSSGTKSPTGGNNTIDGWGFNRNLATNDSLVGAGAFATNFNTSIWSFNGTAVFINNPPVLRTFNRTLAYNGNGNTGGSVPGGGTFINGHTYTAANNTGSLVRAGHTFNGWNTQANGSGTAIATGAVFTMNGNMTLFAQWNIVTPTAAAASNYDKTYFTANWNDTGADSYLLDIATDSNFTNMVTGYSGFPVTGTSQTVTGLLPDTIYYYRVRAVASGNISGNSNIVKVRTARVNREAIVIDQTTNFTVDSDNLQYILDNHIVTDEDIANNNSVTLTLTVKETNDSADGAESIILLSQGRLLQFFDITVEKYINNEPPIELFELPAPVEITIDLSEEMSGKTGYMVYRYHNGVQRIGTNTETDEFFTVSRGSGENNVDQIIIYTKNFSTYAVVENIHTIEGSGSEDVDVQARIVDLTTPVYKIDIAWGDMKFIYNLTESAGTWNPETQKYDNRIAKGWSGFEDGNNQVIVSNHSNADVLVSLDTEIGIASPVTMELFINNIENGTLATNLPLGKVPHNRAALNDVKSISAYLRLKGKPNESDITILKSDTWNRIGIITVTITPDGDVLTPVQ